MTVAAKHLEYRRLRAPREDRSALVDPPWERVASAVEENLQRRESYRCELLGTPVADLVHRARRELLDEAIRWTSAYRNVNVRSFDASSKFFLAGHQPQLFHPGVWFKNFALGSLAQQNDAVAINLIVDSDTIKSSSLRVPTGSADNPQLSLVPFDRPGPVVPFEERSVLDAETFRTFGRRAAEQIAPLVPDPLVREYWPMVLERSRQHDNLGTCLAQARHQLEGQWGLNALELPQSHVCQLPSFAHFTVHLLQSLPRLVPVYNETVGEYRRQHHIRSTAHPVPDLAAEDGWLEAPFWIWTDGDPRRRRAFVRHERGRMRLTDRAGVETTLPCTSGGNPDPAIQRLLELPQQGIRLRSRALVTTLWARLVLSDLFLHGIGGAKYDQVTDAIIARFFGLEPPEFLVVSATLQLPIARQRPDPQDARAIDRRLRDLTWHPETAIDSKLPAADEAAELIAAKAHWINTPQTPDNAHSRWRELRRINGALQPWVADERERLLAERARLADSLKAEAKLAWREYGFCLYPAATLRPFLRDLLPGLSSPL